MTRLKTPRALKPHATVSKFAKYNGQIQGALHRFDEGNIRNPLLVWLVRPKVSVQKLRIFQKIFAVVAVLAFASRSGQ